jgi:ribosomal protein S5
MVLPNPLAPAPGGPAQPNAATTADADTVTVPRPASHKIAIGGIAGSATIIIVWALHGLGIVVPAEVAQAFTMLGSAGLAYLVPDTMQVPS